MPRPRIVVHSMASADGRTDHFTGDVGLYYELAARFPQDAVLAGSGTMVAAAKDHGIGFDVEDEPPTDVPDSAADSGVDGRPLLVVVDAGGRLTRFAWLRGLPYWRDVVVLCAESTPDSHLALLRRHKVRYLIAGTDHVDLKEAVTVLGMRYGVRHIRVDSGGTLNGVLLRAGLVDEISILLGPYVVGGRSPRGLFVADDLLDGTDDNGTDKGGTTSLRLHTVERLRGDVVWLRYTVDR